MTADEWWTRWLAMWYALGWRGVVRRANFNIEDVLDCLALTLMRLRRLESTQPLFGLWF